MNRRSLLVDRNLWRSGYARLKIAFPQIGKLAFVINLLTWLVSGAVLLWNKTPWGIAEMERLEGMEKAAESWKVYAEAMRRIPIHPPRWIDLPPPEPEDPADWWKRL